MRHSLDGSYPPGMNMPITVRFCNRSRHEGGKGGKKGGDDGGGGSLTIGGPPPSYGKGDWKGPSERSGPYGDRVPPQPNANLFVTGLPAAIDVDWIKQTFGQYGNVTECRVLQSNVDPSIRNALVRFGSVEEATNVKHTLSGATIPGCHMTMNLEFAKSTAPPGGAPRDSRKGESGHVPRVVPHAAHVPHAPSVPYPPPPASQQYSGVIGQVGPPPSKGKGKSGKSFVPVEDVIKSLKGKGILPGWNLANDDHALYVQGLPPDTQDIHLFRLCAPFGAVAPYGVMAMKNPDGTCRGFGFVNYVHPESVQIAASALNMAPLPDGGFLKSAPKRAKGNPANSGFSDSLNSQEEHMMGTEPPMWSQPMTNDPMMGGLGYGGGDASGGLAIGEPSWTTPS